MAADAPFGCARRWRVHRTPQCGCGAEWPEFKGSAALATKSPTSAAIAAIARASIAQYSASRRRLRPPIHGVSNRMMKSLLVRPSARRPYLSVAAFAGPSGRQKTRRRSRCRRCRRTSRSTRPGPCASSTASRCPRARRESEDRRQAARLGLHRLQFVVGDAVSGQGPASWSAPSR